jgi:hypothetical protein
MWRTRHPSTFPAWDGTGDEFDMGAYEAPLGGFPTWTPTSTSTPTLGPTLVSPRSDIDGNGRVNATDLLILLGDWKKETE